MFGVSTRQLNLFMLAMQFSKRSAEKVNNCEISIMKIEGEKKVDEVALEVQKRTMESEIEKLKKYEKTINNFDKRYF